MRCWASLEFLDVWGGVYTQSSFPTRLVYFWLAPDIPNIPELFMFIQKDMISPDMIRARCAGRRRVFPDCAGHAMR
jgi:hypothetical protein